MLGYCTNVFPGLTFAEVINNLKTYARPLHKKLDRTIGVGLWLPNNALQQADKQELQDTLAECNAEIFTCNGFPFGDFHSSVVKHKVYEPNWSTSERLEYTKQLAEFLASITTRHDLGISTLPLGWGTEPFTNQECAKVLLHCIDYLEEIEMQTGKCIHLDIEAEPGCRLQTSNDVKDFINAEFGDNEKVRKYLRVCHDICHASVMHESIESCIKNYHDAGLLIGKVQLSSAIEVSLDALSSKDKMPSLCKLAEQRYLHQTTVKTKDKLLFFDDLTEAIEVNANGLWRIHFHVPIHNKTFGGLGTTQDDLKHSIAQLKDAGVTDWEIETYTWDVSPADMKQDDLISSIAKEWMWAQQQINQ